MIVTGAFLAALVGLSRIPVARIDAAAPPPEIAELRILTSVPIFAPLPGGSLEHLAARLVPLRVDAGTVIVREGDAGDRFYIVADGELEVSQDGRTISELDGGGYFGEIALLRDVAPAPQPSPPDRRRAVRTRPGRLPRCGDRTSAECRGGGNGHERAPRPDLRRPATGQRRDMTRRAQVDAVLDEFHARRCGSRRGALLRDTGAGRRLPRTAPGERWAGSPFREFVHSYFSRGKGWRYVPSARSVDIASDGRTAWFDETVENEHYGACRGHRRAAPGRRRVADRAVQPHDPGPRRARPGARGEDP